MPYTPHINHHPKPHYEDEFYTQPGSVSHLSDQTWQLLNRYCSKQKCANVQKICVTYSSTLRKSVLQAPHMIRYSPTENLLMDAAHLGALNKIKPPPGLCNAKQHFCTCLQKYTRVSLYHRTNAYWYFNCSILDFLITKCLYSIHNSIQPE